MPYMHVDFAVFAKPLLLAFIMHVLAATWIFLAFSSSLAPACSMGLSPPSPSLRFFRHQAIHSHVCVELLFALLWVCFFCVVSHML